jgi:hypothetical protein
MLNSLMMTSWPGIGIMALHVDRVQLALCGTQRTAEEAGCNDQLLDHTKIWQLHGALSIVAMQGCH